jgi:hypothetical protein
VPVSRIRREDGLREAVRERWYRWLGLCGRDASTEDDTRRDRRCGGRRKT